MAPQSGEKRRLEADDESDDDEFEMDLEHEPEPQPASPVDDVPLAMANAVADHDDGQAEGAGGAGAAPAAAPGGNAKKRPDFIWTEELAALFETSLDAEIVRLADCSSCFDERIKGKALLEGMQLSEPRRLELNINADKVGNMLKAKRTALALEAMGRGPGAPKFLQLMSHAECLDGLQRCAFNPSWREEANNAQRYRHHTSHTAVERVGLYWGLASRAGQTTGKPRDSSGFNRFNAVGDDI